MKQVRCKDRWLFGFIVALSIVLRFYQFPTLPAGLNVDEANAGYDSYALLLHGTDRWGNPFPVYFPGRGSGFSVLLSYLNLPWIKFFGLTVFAQRFPSALLSVLTIVVLYACVKQWYDTRTALIAAFLLTITPWHIMMSRWAMDCNILPCFLLLGIASLSYCYTSKHSKKLIPFSLFFLALSFYAYAVSIVIIPIILVLYLLWFDLRNIGHNKFAFFLSLMLFLLVAAPFFLFILDDMILRGTPSIVEHLPFTAPVLIGSRLTEIATRQGTWASNAQFLISGFNDHLVWNMADVYAPLGLLTLPLIAIGIYYSLKKRQVHANLFLIWLIATIPIFFLFPLNINRANAIFIPLIALCAIGISGLYDSIDKQRTKMAVLSLILTALTLYNGLFCYYYFTSYNDHIKVSFNAGFDIALIQARSLAAANEPMYVSDRVNTNYIYTLFFLKADPVDFQKHAQVVVYNGVYFVLKYKRYYFYPHEAGLNAASSFVGILKGNEHLNCARQQRLSSAGDWTVIRCFNK